MVVRFDNARVQQTVDRKSDAIGVEGDLPNQRGGISEAEGIVLEQRKKLEGEGEKLDRASSGIMEEEDDAEPGPELNSEALEAARKDKMPQPPSSTQ